MIMLHSNKQINKLVKSYKLGHTLSHQALEQFPYRAHIIFQDLIHKCGQFNK